MNVKSRVRQSKVCYLRTFHSCYLQHLFIFSHPTDLSIAEVNFAPESLKFVVFQPQIINASLLLNVSTELTDFYVNGQPKVELYFITKTFKNRIFVSEGKLDLDINIQFERVYQTEFVDTLMVPGPRNICEDLDNFCVRIFPPDEFSYYEISERSLENNKKCVSFQKQCQLPEIGKPVNFSILITNKLSNLYHEHNSCVFLSLMTSI